MGIIFFLSSLVHGHCLLHSLCTLSPLTTMPATFGEVFTNLKGRKINSLIDMVYLEALLILWEENRLKRFQT